MTQTFGYHDIGSQMHYKRCVSLIQYQVTMAAVKRLVAMTSEVKCITKDL